MQLSERQWKTLAKDLQQQRCILLLGTRLATAKDAEGHDQHLSEMLSRHLASLLDAEQIAYDRDSASDLSYIAQRFLAMPRIRRIDLEDEVAEFYRKHVHHLPEVYQQLGRLPFFMAVNLAPEDFMARAFRAAGKAGTQALHYNFRKERNAQIGAPAPAKPLVYNLLGTLTDPESLVLSQEDRVEFIKNVVKSNPGIPNAVMSHFDSRKTYVFLGFNLENWDYRLLCDALQLGKDNMTFSPDATAHALAPEARSFYEDHFRFVFVDYDIRQFVNGLEQSFTELEAENAATQAPAALRKVVVLFDRNESDTRCCHTLCDHLAGWVQKGALEIWHRDMPFAGNEEQELQRRLNEADAVLPLLSAGFLSNHDLMTGTLPEILRQHSARGLRVIPLIHRACDWEATTLTQFPALPAGGKPIRNWPDEDEAFKNTIEHLKLLLYA